MKSQQLFEALLTAETEDDVEVALKRADLDQASEATWHPFGDMPNNFGAIGNQQADATAAMVEKIINAVDAVLMAKCFGLGIDPESGHAPQTMDDAVRRFFDVRDGKFENLTAEERTKVADLIHIVALGSRSEPNYLIVDRGEGQTPKSFPKTFLSLLASNKLRIPFVQGKFNAGGTGILQFCGERNYQLIVSRRHPEANVERDDTTSKLWGFTLVKRLPPAGNRKSSTYVYLRPQGQILSFAARSIDVLPGRSRGPNHPPVPYAAPLEYGTCVKLYNYKWRAKSTATTEARYELERFLHHPALPLRITETRDYKANFYSTTLSGIWVSIGASKAGEGEIQVEDGFPAFADLRLEQTGRLPYSIVVYKEGIDTRHVPHGVFFTVNGQVHGSLPADFITRRLRFDYLRAHLMVSVDCTNMPGATREDMFMASRDRIRQNDVTAGIADELERELKDHPGLRELNAARRAQRIADSLDDNREAVDVLQQLVHLDPTLGALLGLGQKLMVKAGASEAPAFKGRRFPTFFRFAKDPGVKKCPLNRSIRVELVTDAVNDYFSRPDSPGELTLDSRALCEHTGLWNGEFTTRWRPPLDAKIGDEVDVVVTVSDVQRNEPFVSKFQMRITPPEVSDARPPGPRQPRTKKPDEKGRKEVPQVAMPNIVEVQRDSWPKYEFTESTALRIKHGEKGDGLDFFLNVDNGHLAEQLRRAQPSDHKLVRYWFKYGLALCALGVLQEEKRIAQRVAADKARDVEDPDLDKIGSLTDGLARVIVPVVKTLYRGPQG